MKKLAAVSLAVLGTALIMFSLAPLGSFLVLWPSIPLGGPRFWISLVCVFFILIGGACILVSRKIFKSAPKK
ncbi:MAG: hypothetical protein JNM12_04600 [Alphaproteobacteria bacterium]|nr:hypothetical protein [Alphaproteobacteria bacterium]